MVPIDSQWVVSYSTSIDPIVVSVTVFEIFECNFNDLELVGSKSSKVRDHCPNQKSVDCFLSHLIVSDVVSRTVFDIFDAKIPWPWIRTVQGHSGSKVMVPIDSPWVVFYSTSIDPIMHCCVTAAVLDIPVYKSRIQSLHALFSLFAAFKNSQVSCFTVKVIYCTARHQQHFTNLRNGTWLAQAIGTARHYLIIHCLW